MAQIVKYIILNIMFANNCKLDKRIEYRYVITYDNVQKIKNKMQIETCFNHIINAFWHNKHIKYVKKLINKI